MEIRRKQCSNIQHAQMVNAYYNIPRQEGKGSCQNLEMSFMMARDDCRKALATISKMACFDIELPLCAWLSH